MKTLKKILGIGLMAFFITLAAPHKSMAQEGGYVSDQEFYDNLQQYGTWIDDPDYGNVWVPDVDGDFRPYATRGHWVQTDYGSTWVSDYPWGWATFHYGRWRYDDYYGWEWIPGHEWAPAWVSWRHGGGYYGWAPLMPGISITISFGGGYRVPDNYWVCAPEAYINRPNIYNYYVPHTRAITIIHNTTIVNNTYIYNNRTYVTGPRPQEIQRYTHQRVQVYRINNASRPGTNIVQNNTVNIYRPAIRQTPNARPARVINAVAYKQANPNQRIGRQGATGPGYNRVNAQKLAQEARSTNPNTNVVRVNPAGNNRPAQPATQPAAGNRPGQPANNNRKPGTNSSQPATRPTQPGTPATVQGHRAPGEVRPNEPAAGVARRAQQKQQQIQQQTQQRQQRVQQETQQKQQQVQQQAQQKQQQIQQQGQQQTRERQQQVQQQAQQKQQQLQQQAQQRQQRVQQEAQQKQQQAQQQTQQRQQQQAQQRQQQQAQQRQQQQAQQAQQRQQQQQQQAQQRQQQAQQAQQRQQQQQAQAQQRQQAQRQQQQKQQQQQHKPQPQPKPEGQQ